MVAQWRFKLVTYQLPFVYVKYTMSITQNTTQILVLTLIYKNLQQSTDRRFFCPLLQSTKALHYVTIINVCWKLNAIFDRSHLHLKFPHITIPSLPEISGRAV
jgi:hypothetical protein